MSSEENKALILRWFAETDRGNLDIIDELLPDDYVDHNPPLPGLHRRPRRLSRCSRRSQ